jgi:cell division protein FtsI/penicillin-binding protein 2
MLNLAIGQGELLVTPLQMAVLTAAVANGGTLYRPHVLHEVTSPQGDQVVQGGESIKGQLPIRSETLQLLQEAMIAVVNRGTGARVRLGYTQVAGKTGTAENPHGEDHSWFIGYAPAGQPRIAVAAIIENAPHGMAVPIVRQVIDAYLSPGRTPPSVSLRSIRDNQP